MARRLKVPPEPAGGGVGAGAAAGAGAADADAVAADFAVAALVESVWVKDAPSAE
jgi:hypothetical protein